MSDEIARIRSSLALALERQPRLTHRSLHITMERYPESRAMFYRNPHEVHEKLLMNLITSVVDRMEDAEWVADTLAKLGTRHLDFAVTPHMYAWVEDGILSALAEALGPDWTPELDALWRGSYRQMSGIMIAAAEAARASRADAKVG